MARKHTDNKELTNLERQIMEVIWKLKKTTSKEIKEHLDAEKPLALTTILTVLARLMEKKYIKEIPSLGRTRVFQPIIPKESVAGKTLRKVIKQFFSGSPSELMAHLLKNENISEEELGEIRNLLETKYKKEKK